MTSPRIEIRLSVRKIQREREREREDNEEQEKSDRKYCGDCGERISLLYKVPRLRPLVLMVGVL
jgi:hypothetical protein